MTKILENLPLFIQTLENKTPMTCNPKKGEWKILGSRSKFINKMIKRKEDDKVLQAFHRILVDIEKYPLYIQASDKILEKQQKFYQEILQAGRLIVQLHLKSDDANIQRLNRSLNLALIKLQYRIQIENGGLQILNLQEIDPELVTALEQKVDDWKKQDEKFEHTQEGDFSLKIQDMCCYPEIIKFMLDPLNAFECKKYLDEILNGNYDLDTLNQYPDESAQLSKVRLNQRLGALSHRLISVDLVPDMQGGLLKKLNLLMEGHKVNVLDKKQKVRFSNGLECTLAEIYKDFKDKNLRPGDFEVFYEGILPFNGHHLGPRIVDGQKNKKYKILDTSQTGWYEKTPILDMRSRDYLEKRYNIEIEPGQWVIPLYATRREELDVVNSHGYCVIYQPIENSDNYRVYSFGAFPWNFPQGYGLFTFVGDTVEGTVTLDPNYYYWQSQKASWAPVVNPEVAQALLKELGLQKKTGFHFQFAWENCAFFIRNVYNKVFKSLNLPLEVPNFFTKKFLKMKPSGALKVIHRFFTKLSIKLRPLLLKIFSFLFLTWRSLDLKIGGKKVKKNLFQTPFVKEMKGNFPSAMHYRIKKQKLPGVLNYGHRPDVALAKMG